MLLRSYQNLWVRSPGFGAGPKAAHWPNLGSRQRRRPTAKLDRNPSIGLVRAYEGRGWGIAFDGYCIFVSA